MENKTYPLRMRKDLVERIDRLAEKRHIPRATLARSLIAEGLNRLDKEEAAPAVCVKSGQQEKQR